MPLACLRSLFSLAFVASVLLLGGAFYLEFTKGLVPCPLCQSQRVLLGVFAAVCLVARVHAPAQAGARRYAAVALALAGVFSNTVMIGIPLVELAYGKAGWDNPFFIAYAPGVQLKK